MSEPTEKDIARIRFVQERMMKDMRFAARKDVYGLDVEANLFLLLEEWEKKLKELE